MTDRGGLLDAADLKTLGERYASAQSEVPPRATEQVLALRRDFLQRRRELGVSPPAMPSAGESVAIPTADRIAATEPQTAPPKGRFKSCLHTLFLIWAILFLIGFVLRLLGLR